MQHGKIIGGRFCFNGTGEYPFSERYGWLQENRDHLSWQLILSDPGGEERPFIVPSLMFIGDVCGKAEEAVKFYLSVFQTQKTGDHCPLSQRNARPND